MDDSELLIRHYQKLHSDQSNWRMLWNTIAQYVLPAWDNFIGYFPEGVIRTNRIFDGTGISANEHFAAIMESMLTPRTQMWHDIMPMEESLNEDGEVQAYCAAVRKALFAARYRPRANYASQSDECYLQIGAFGNSALLIDEVMGKNLVYISIPMSQICWALDASGMVDTVYRRFEYTARQCVQKWGLDNVSEPIRKAYGKDPYADFSILHAVRPNSERDAQAPGARGMAYESVYLDFESRQTMERGGYRTFPYAIGRYRMAPREHYGRSPASVALPAIRTLNEQKKTALRAGQKMVDPPLLLAEEGALTQFSLRAGSLNYGMLSAEGEPLVQPLQIQGNMELGKELMQLETTAINDAFLKTYFDILVQNPEMTATQALMIAQQKAQLITPAMGRQQSEFLGPQIVREIDILHHAGVLPPPPKKLLESGGIRIEYTSPLSKLMRAEEASTIMTSLQGLGQVAAIKPEVLDWVNWDEMPPEYLEASGFPGKLIATPEQVQEVRAQRQQQQQAAAVAQNAPGMSQAALNLAKAQQTASTPGGGGAQPQPGGG